MPEPITAPMPSAIRLQTPSDFFSRLSGLFGSRDQSIDALGAKELAHPVGSRSRQPDTANELRYRFLWPFVIFFTLFFMEPRATPDARLALGAAFLREARFSFLRSALSVMFFVFILFLSGFLRIFPPASSNRNRESLQ